MWEGQALPHDTKFSNCRCEICTIRASDQLFHTTTGIGYTNKEATLFYFPHLTWQWRHNGRDGVSNHHPHDCLLNRLFRRRSKKTSKLRVTGLCEKNPPVNSPASEQFYLYLAAKNSVHANVKMQTHWLHTCNNIIWLFVQWYLQHNCVGDTIGYLQVSDIVRQPF